jgi:hypothetical protein
MGSVHAKANRISKLKEQGVVPSENTGRHIDQIIRYVTNS